MSDSKTTRTNARLLRGLPCIPACLILLVLFISPAAALTYHDTAQGHVSPGNSPAHGVAWSPTGSHVAFTTGATGSSNLSVWEVTAPDVLTPRAAKSITTGFGEPRSVFWHDSTTLAITSTAGTVVWGYTYNPTTFALTATNPTIGSVPTTPGGMSTLRNTSTFVLAHEGNPGMSFYSYSVGANAWTRDAASVLSLTACDGGSGEVDFMWGQPESAFSNAYRPIAHARRCDNAGLLIAEWNNTLASYVQTYVQGTPTLPGDNALADPGALLFNPKATFNQSYLSSFDILAVAWRKFSINTTVEGEVRLYKWNGNTLDGGLGWTHYQTLGDDLFNPTTMTWSKDGRYLYVGNGLVTNAPNDKTRVFLKDDAPGSVFTDVTSDALNIPYAGRSTTSTVQSAVSPNGQYLLMANATNANHWKFYTATALPLPNAPQNVVAVGANQQVTISWTPVEGADYYHVYADTVSHPDGCCDVPPSFYTRFINVTGQASNHVVDRNLVNGVPHYYRVMAWRLSDLDNAYSGEVTATPRNAPVLTGALGMRTAVLSWTTGGWTSPLNFTLYRGTEVNELTPYRSLSGASRGFNDEVEPDSAYWYGVTVSNATATSPLSNQVQVNAPALFTWEGNFTRLVPDQLTVFINRTYQETYWVDLVRYDSEGTPRSEAAAKPWNKTAPDNFTFRLPATRASNASRDLGTYHLFVTDGNGTYLDGRNLCISSSWLVPFTAVPISEACPRAFPMDDGTRGAIAQESGRETLSVRAAQRQAEQQASTQEDLFNILGFFMGAIDVPGFTRIPNLFFLDLGALILFGMAIYRRGTS